MRIAIAGSILGNALLLGGIAGLMPTIRARGRNLTSLRFDHHLFSSIATLAVVAVVPIAILSFGTTIELGGRRARTSRSRPASACSRSARSSS